MRTENYQIADLTNPNVYGILATDLIGAARDEFDVARFNTDAAKIYQFRFLQRKNLLLFEEDAKAIQGSQ